MPRCLVLVLLVVLLLVSAGRGAPVQAPSGRSDAFGDPLPPYALLRIGTTRFRHGDAITALVVSADGKTIYSAGRDDTVRAWELATGKELRRWQRDDDAGSTVQIASLALSHDGKRLATACAGGGKVTLWNPETGQPLRTLTKGAGANPFLAFTDNGDTLLVHRDRTIHLHNAVTGETARTFRLETENNAFRRREKEDMETFTLSPDGSLLLTGQANGAVRLWDVANGMELAKFDDDSERIGAAAVSADNNWYAWGTARGWLHIGKVSGDELHRLSPDGNRWIDALAFSPDGKYLACGAGGGVISILTPADGQEVCRIDAHGESVSCLAFTPDSSALVSGGYDRCIRVWDVRTGKEKTTTHANRGRILVALSADGSRLATTGGGQPAHCWDARTGKEISTVPLTDYAFGSLVLSPDGARLTALADSTLVSFDTDTGRELRRRYLDPDLQQGVLSPDGRTIAGRTTASNLYLYRVPTDKRPTVPRGNDALFRFVLSPDGLCASTLGSAGDVRLWDALTGKELNHFKVPGRVFHLAFTPDKGLLLSLSVRNSADASGQRIGRWVTDPGAPLPDFQGDQGDPVALAVSPDGKTLVTGDETGALRLWEIATGKSRGVLKGHQGAIVSLAFSADGRRLASGSKDTTALLWDLTLAASASELSDKQLDALWADLLSDDAPVAYRAITTLALSPGRVVPYLTAHVRPAAVDAKQVSRLIADLDHPAFETRQKAHAALVAWSELAEPQLRTTLKEPPSAEVRRSVEDLLMKLKTTAFTPEPASTSQNSGGHWKHWRRATRQRRGRR